MRIRIEKENNENEVKRQHEFKTLEFNKFRAKPEELEKWNNENPDKMIIISAEEWKDYQDHELWENNLTFDEKMAKFSGKLKYPDKLGNSVDNKI